MMSTSTIAGVKIIMSPDRLRVWVRVNPQLDPKTVTRGHLLAALEESKIALTPGVDSRLIALCERLQEANLPGEDFLLAECPPPTDPVDARFEWSELLRPRSEGRDPRGRPSQSL